jgi:putative zinc finger/helix-turn-helix YgiT family protein
MKTAPERPRKKSVLPPQCPECGNASHWVSAQIHQEQEFRGETLTVTAPVHQCSDCGFGLMTTDDANELLRSTVAAWQQANELMTGPEIREARGRRHWSQQQLADVSGVSIATIKRLELGSVVQTDVNDDALREAFGGSIEQKCRVVFSESVEVSIGWQPDDPTGEAWKYGTMRTHDAVTLASLSADLCHSS